MRAFKGFNKDLTCRGYQYEEGKEFQQKERSAVIQVFTLASIR